MVRDLGPEADKSAAILALIENLQRDDLNPIDQAKAYRYIADTFHLTQEQIAERLGFRLVDHRMELYGVALDRKG